jgi:putative copper export protein
MLDLTPQIAVETKLRSVASPRVVTVAALLAGLAVILTAPWWLEPATEPPPAGVQVPGRLTTTGLPVAKHLHEIAGMAVVGLLLVRSLMSGGRGAASAHLVAMVARWSWVWAGSTLVWAVFCLSEVTGVPVSQLASRGSMTAVVAGSPVILAQTATIWVALGLALFAAHLASRAHAAAALVLATAALLPAALVRHVEHRSVHDHDNPAVAAVALISLALHIVSASFWVGGLLAVVVHLRGFGRQIREVVPRFSGAALLFIVVVGLSGIVQSAATVQGWDAVWNTDRGHLIMIKSVALALLMLIGFAHRRYTVEAARSGKLLPLLALAAGELVVMGATVGVAVVLAPLP